MGTWDNAVDAYVCLTDFARDKFVARRAAGGQAAREAELRPPGPRPERTGVRDGSAVFVGRLSEEKGVLPLLAAWEHRWTCR